MMYPGYAIVILIHLGYICCDILSYIRRSPLGVIASFAMLIFMEFMDSALILGGSASYNAQENYELYQEGHYYLSNHGNYTEVSYEVFRYMEIIEVVGIIAFVIAFVTIAIRNKLEKGSFFPRA
jgi:Ni,Fe-hydrogenase I cytochrome b subunit